jgi:hypothetical protein
MAGMKISGIGLPGALKHPHPLPGKNERIANQRNRGGAASLKTPSPFIPSFYALILTVS